MLQVIEYLQSLFEQHGYLVLFTGLLLEFIALPFPGETTMAYSGFLAYKGLLSAPLLVLIALAGTTLGITLTYWIGRKAGYPFIQKYGKWFMLSPKKLDKTRIWFDKYGAFLIFIGYFIPGVRHFTGYFSGIIKITFRRFALYAYTGALFWTILFIGIGSWFGPQWNQMFHLAASYSAYAAILILVIAAAIALYKFRRVLPGFRVQKAVRAKGGSDAEAESAAAPYSTAGKRE